MFTIQTSVENYPNNTCFCILLNLRLRCEIFLFADLHEFGGKPVGLQGKGSLSCLYRVWNERRKAFKFSEQVKSKDFKQVFFLIMAPPLTSCLT